MDATKLISQAREIRDSSLGRIEPPLENIPDTLPKNVTRIANDVLTAKELEITALDAPELLKAIREKLYLCEEVTRAFLRRAALAQKLVSHTHSFPETNPLKLSRQTASQSSSPSERFSEPNISTRLQRP